MFWDQATLPIPINKGDNTHKKGRRKIDNGVILHRKLGQGKKTLNLNLSSPQQRRPPHLAKKKKTERLPVPSAHKPPFSPSQLLSWPRPPHFLISLPRPRKERPPLSLFTTVVPIFPPQTTLHLTRPAPKQLLIQPYREAAHLSFPHCLSSLTFSTEAFPSTASSSFFDLLQLQPHRLASNSSQHTAAPTDPSPFPTETNDQTKLLSPPSPSVRRDRSPVAGRLLAFPPTM